ncbi:MAG: helix-turn-helix domain-containing protein, partial [Acidimicrobiales bacterium]
MAGPIGAAGAAFYVNPDTLARGKELGLDGFRFYVLGRGGVMGDVPAKVVESAFGYFT